MSYKQKAEIKKKLEEKINEINQNISDKESEDDFFKYQPISFIDMVVASPETEAKSQVELKNELLEKKIHLDKLIRIKFKNYVYSY